VGGPDTGVLTRGWSLAITENVVVTSIDTETLRSWLVDGRPVEVVDIRSHDDRAQWAIPGSIHVDAYDALRRGEAGPLADVQLPLDRPVVTVCGQGRTSEVAADLLSRRGVDARSLSGGMKAWSLAWNVAPVTLAGSPARVVQVRRTGKGCLSYLVGEGDEALVIDPSVGPDVYLEAARGYGWTIRHVLDTHVHADHLSRARDLARLSGATLVLPAQNRVRFPFTPVADGGEIPVGAATLRAMYTPGHTAESTSYILDDSAVFTGDTLFTKSVGRPDLHADPDAARARARLLFASLGRLRRLPPDTIALPGHTSEPVAFDRQPIAARLGDIDPWLAEWLVSEPAFVERVTSHLPPTPPNFVRIVELNESGELPEGDAADLEAGANRCAIS
jgi:glyoxylase-like metal-dependent hydrolase (beta-lactamase superfamily II)/rhodanese-related sulfurtransferase